MNAVRYYVYEAEYATLSGGVIDWTAPDPKTIRVHGPFDNYEDALSACKGRTWASVDLAYHRACVIDNLNFNPEKPETHHMVVGAEQYWGRA